MGPTLPSCPSQLRPALGPHLRVLVGGHGDELGLLEGEDVRVGSVAGRLRLPVVHLDNVQPRLVLMERLEHDHLRENRMLAGVEGTSTPTVAGLMAPLERDPEATVSTALSCYRELPPGPLAPVPSLSRAPALPSCPVSYPPDVHCDQGMSTSSPFQGWGSVNSIAQLRETLHPFWGPLAPTPCPARCTGDGSLGSGKETPRAALARVLLNATPPLSLRFSSLPPYPPPSPGVWKRMSQRERKVTFTEQNQPEGVEDGKESHLGHIVRRPFVVREL